MKHNELKIYGTTVQVYELNKGESILDHLDIPENREGSLVTILDNGKYLPSSREKQSFFALGQTEDKDYVVLAEGIDSKQLGNILLSLGVETTSRASITDVSKFKLKQDKEEGLAPVYSTVDPDPANFKDEVEVKPKSKRRSRKKTEE
jgi:hypothetical protein